MRDKLKYFFLSLFSRKFLLAIAGAFIAHEVGMADGVLTIQEVGLVLAPLLAFIGIEGLGDAAARLNL